MCTFTRVMPSAWSWNHSAVARWSLVYWNVALPGDQLTPSRCANALLKVLYQVPTVA
jgi:hypothetical protein